MTSVEAARDRFDLARFSAGDMVLCGSGLRRAAAGADSLEAGAAGIVRYLYESLREREGGLPDLVLTRFYRTVDYSRLSPDLQRFAEASLRQEPARPDMKCLTLMASAGVRPEWNSRHSSVGHRAIPLPSSEAVARLPMVARLIHQLGLTVADLVGESAAAVVTGPADGAGGGTFYIEEAQGSPFVPAQADFVVPYGVRSVVGFGGALTSGDLYAVILFTRRHIPRSTADLFGYLGSDIRMAIAPLLRRPLFAAP
ncbi:MAG: hypothetical protein NVS9B1_16110 [Candidatus Dormibacteraceae bacterium]